MVFFQQRGKEIGSITLHYNTLLASIYYLNYIWLHLRGMLILSNDLLDFLVFPCFAVKGLFTRWGYKQLEIQQTSCIPFHWKRLKLALSKAVSTSCSNNLAATSSGQLSCMGERGCVFCQVVHNAFLTPPFFLSLGSESHSALPKGIEPL